MLLANFEKLGAPGESNFVKKVYILRGRSLVYLEWFFFIASYPFADVKLATCAFAI